MQWISVKVDDGASRTVSFAAVCTKVLGTDFAGTLANAFAASAEKAWRHELSRAGCNHVGTTESVSLATALCLNGAECSESADTTTCSGCRSKTTTVRRRQCRLQQSGTDFIRWHTCECVRSVGGEGVVA